MIFGFHAILVFLIPALFGWTVFRRILREHDIVILASGSVVTGFVALMALVNELRYLLEMPEALWFAYKILLGSTLAILIFARRPRHPILWSGQLKGRWRLGLVAAGAVTVCFYFGIPAWRGFLDDAWWGHYPIAVQIQTAAHFPVCCPFAPDDQLFYHFGPDILASALAFLLLLPVQQGFALMIVLLAPATFLLAFGLTLRLSRSYWSALAAACFLLVGGNLRFLGLAAGNFGTPAARLQIFNSQTIQGLLQLIFTPSHALGIPLMLVVLVAFRHFLARPTWPLAALVGLLLGSLTLVAEWYFIPLGCALALCLGSCGRRFRCSPIRMDHRCWTVLLAPLLISLAVGLYNNTYLSGYFSYFWTRHSNLSDSAFSREILANLKPAVAESSVTVRSAAAGLSALPFAPPLISVRRQEAQWSAPQLVPLKLNFAHIGQAPSWQSANSSGGSWVALWSGSFLLEFFPVIGLGIPFGLAWWRRSRNPLLLAILLLAIGSLIPPVLLDWGYRSTDFLRFFTGAFSFSALLLGCFVGRLLERPGRWQRGLGILVTIATLANAAALGVLGLMPGTMTTIMKVGSQGLSLSDATGKSPGPKAGASISPADNREQAFARLARQLDGFLFPITQGRDRAIVIVPTRELPPLTVFPEWMKLATLSRVLLPIGWHWSDSAYAGYYRAAVLDLDAEAVAALGARWVIVTNLWGYSPPGNVVRALGDRSRFAPADTFTDGPYYLALYRVL